jgi:hypothetical protein
MAGVSAAHCKLQGIVRETHVAAAHVIMRPDNLRKQQWSRRVTYPVSWTKPIALRFSKLRVLLLSAEGVERHQQLLHA